MERGLLINRGGVFTPLQTMVINDRIRDGICKITVDNTLDDWRFLKVSYTTIFMELQAFWKDVAKFKPT